ncbi:hypothetical protein NDU88_006011 [Pleurodeles waltl]|uniref:Uncharacterized protein n=1 Tax=Pleurodeles waltl TaxID=8319 RepID=A0AAV7VNR2_PLEWA|nr:hypothetical protein NDU88_006011 [Pleurodeles waltl]
MAIGAAGRASTPVARIRRGAGPTSKTCPANARLCRGRKPTGPRDGTEDQILPLLPWSTFTLFGHCAGCDLHCWARGAQPRSRPAPPAPVPRLHRDFTPGEDTCVVLCVQRSRPLYKQRTRCTVVVLDRTPIHRRTPRIGLSGISMPISLHYTGTPRNPLPAITGRSINISTVPAPRLALTAPKLEPHHHSAIAF